MPIYRYKAVNASGDVAVGELDAANESEIVDRLRDQGLLPMQVARAAAAKGSGVRHGDRGGRRGRAPPVPRAEARQRATICSRSPASSQRCSARDFPSTARWRS